MTAAARVRPSGIITPEAVVLEFETAGVASRMLARLIDGAVLWFALLLVAIALPVLPDSGAVVGIVIVVLLVFGSVFGYWMAFETLWRGRTIGKAALGLRVVTIEGAPVRLRHSAIRAMVGVVDFLLPPLGPVAVLCVLFSPRDQRLGDMAAGTIVLRERSVTGPVQALVLIEPPGRAELMSALALAPPADDEYALVRRFLLRVPELHPDARADIGYRLAGAISASTGVAVPTGLHHEWFLHAAGLAHQRRFAPVVPHVTDTMPPPPPPTGRPVAVATPPGVGHR